MTMETTTINLRQSSALSLSRERGLQRSLRAELLAQGFTFFRAAEIGLPARLTPAQAKFVKLAQVLPLDRYARKQDRFRCLNHAVYTPSNRRLTFRPACVDPETGERYVPFTLGDENPEHAHETRRFAPMPNAMRDNPALLQLVRRDFELTPFAERATDDAFAVTFHVIRQVVEPGGFAVSTPDLVHTDDVLLSFVHVIEREDVVGGVNLITKREHAGKRWDAVPIEDVHALVTVTDPFSGYAFLDDKVGHYVSAIKAASKDKAGARTILIVDFAPMRPVQSW